MPLSATASEAVIDGAIALDIKHALVLRPRAVEDLAREILKDRVLPLAERIVERGAAPAKVFP